MNPAQEWRERLEEFGSLHNEDCFVHMEDPGKCECENMKILMGIVARVRKETLEQVRERVQYLHEDIEDVLNQLETQE